VESTDGAYGWAPDDPRWTDMLAGGNGRLEPSPAPRFGASEVPEVPEVPDDSAPEPSAVDDLLRELRDLSRSEQPAVAEDALPAWPPAPTDPLPPTATPPASAAPWPPVPSSSGQFGAGPDEWDVAPWIVEDSAFGADAPRPWTESPTPWQPPAWPASGPTAAPWPPVSHETLPGFEPPARPSPLPDMDAGPLGIAAQPAALPYRLPPSGPTGGNGATPASVPFTIHTQFPTPGLRSGYGLSTAEPLALPPGPNGADLPARAWLVGTRLDRRVRLHMRRRADDEFRRAGRAELFSDDARYPVLLWLTAAWYIPIAVVYLGWVAVLGGNQGTTGSRVLGGLLWLTAGAALSLGVAGLLRWAAVGWRAITLSIAAAVIGGAVVTIAHTLAS
jgi:hypothetical protein